MKKYLNTALVYAAAAMAGGVFYREFTKWNDFTGVTALGKVHVHFFFLGMMMFLVVSLFSLQLDLQKQKLFRMFFFCYNIGVPLTGILLVVRGVVQVLGIPLSKGASASISGIAGMGHILTGIGLVLLLLSLKKASEEKA